MGRDVPGVVTLKVIEDAILTLECSYLHFTASSLPNSEVVCCFVEVATKRRGGPFCVFKYQAWCTEIWNLECWSMPISQSSSGSKT